MNATSTAEEVIAALRLKLDCGGTGDPKCGCLTCTGLRDALADPETLAERPT
jgi:hypothetical protein